MDNQLLLLSKIYNELGELSEEAYEQHVTQLLEEQPHLIGFIFNLAEQMEEDETAFIVYSAVVVSQVFKTLTYPMEMVDEVRFEKILNTELGNFNDFFKEKNESIEALFQICSSPDTVAALFSIYAEQKGDPFENDEWLQVLTLLDIVVATLEESISTDFKP